MQIEVLDHAAQRFSDIVVRPALQEPRGAPRLKALFERWIAWENDVSLPGGCIFVAATTELDDRPGPVRDRLPQPPGGWINVIATSFRKGVDAGLFRAGADPQQFAQDMYGIMLSLHFHRRLMRDREADARARRAFDALLERAAPCVCFGPPSVSAARFLPRSPRRCRSASSSRRRGGH